MTGSPTWSRNRALTGKVNSELGQHAGMRPRPIHRYGPFFKFSATLQLVHGAAYSRLQTSSRVAENGRRSVSGRFGFGDHSRLIGLTG